MSGHLSYIIVPLLLMMVEDIGVFSIPPQEQHNPQHPHPLPTTPLPTEQSEAVHENQNQTMNSFSFVVAGTTPPQSNFGGPSLQDTLQRSPQDVPEPVAQVDPKLVSTKDSQKFPQVKTEPLASVDPQTPVQVKPEQRKKDHPLPSSAFCLNQNSSMPVKLDCDMFLNTFNITFNSSVPCTFNCTYNPEQLPFRPVRLHVNTLDKHPTHHPTFIIAQQAYNLSAWTLPTIFPSLGLDQKYTSMESTLCPPWMWHEGDETISLRFSTSNTDAVHNQVRLIKDQNFELVKGENQSVHISPTMPWYKLYRWEAHEESVLVTTDSRGKLGNDVCARLLIQNARCPVMVASQQPVVDYHRYQSFSRRGAMVASRHNFPDGLFIVVISLPDDVPCTLVDTAGTNRTSRSKTLYLDVYQHNTISSNWYTFALTLVFVVGAVGAITAVTVMTFNKSLGGNASEDDQEQLIGGSLGSSGSRGQYRVEVGAAFVAGGGRGTPGMHNGLCTAVHERPSGPTFEEILDDDDDVDQGIGAAEGNRDRTQREVMEGSHGRIAPGHHLPIAGCSQPAYPPPATYAPPADLTMTATFNPRYVMWWKKVAVFESQTAEAQVSEVGFQNNLIIMALFAGLPTAELLRSYLRVMLYSGAEDQCFFNSRCLTDFWPFHDFARVFTNIGYLVAGGAFVFIVQRHQKLTLKILDTCSADDSLGVSRHYGLYTSLGLGLIIQGIMSSLYHTCPNSVTIRFDMMFMYILLTVCILCMWGLRHGDVTHHIYPTTMAIGVVLVMAELREWMSRDLFWGMTAVLYIAILLPNVALMSRCGIWSFSPRNLWKVWKGWSPEVLQNLYVVVRQEDRSSTPLKVVRIAAGLAANVVLMGCGIGLDPNVYTFILVVCLVNTTLYIFNYVLTKRVGFGERGQLLAWVCLGSSLVLWVPALLFYFIHDSDSEASPSESRALNAMCSIMGVYDYHDLWHLTSAFALFLFFIALLTLDDDLCRESSKRIHVF